MDYFINNVELIVEIVEQDIKMTEKGILKTFNFKFFRTSNFNKIGFIRGVSFDKQIAETKYDKNKRYKIKARLNINTFKSNKFNCNITNHSLIVDKINKFKN